MDNDPKDTDPKPDDKVGYKRPPKAFQYKPGQSGHPAGRPKGSKNFTTEVQDELKTRITVVESGARKKITKRKAAAKQLVNQAVNGNPKALAVILAEDRVRENRADTNPALPGVALDEDMKTIANIFKRMQETENPLSIPEPTPEQRAKDQPSPSSSQQEDKS